LTNSKDINKKTDSVCAVVPFFNEKETLRTVLDETLDLVDFIIAVNDGSTDDDYLDLQNNSKLKIINFERNSGKGKALKSGFEEAVKSGFKIVVTLDADLQHEPKHIHKLIDALSSFDIVIGNRLKNLQGMPIQRRLSNALTSYLLTIKTGQKILDSQCGFRAFKIEVLKKVKTRYNGFEAESEFLVKAAKQGFKFGFVDIPTVYGNETSKMRPLQAIIGFLRVLFSRSTN
jgi:glycosyltransferase involved in cell wall biosynthesis